MVELLTLNPWVKGSSPAITAGNEREKNGDGEARGGTTLGKVME